MIVYQIIGNECVRIYIYTYTYIYIYITHSRVPHSPKAAWAANGSGPVGLIVPPLGLIILHLATGLSVVDVCVCPLRSCCRPRTWCTGCVLYAHSDSLRVVCAICMPSGFGCVPSGATLCALRLVSLGGGGRYGDSPTPLLVSEYPVFRTFLHDVVYLVLGHDSRWVLR